MGFFCAEWPLLDARVFITMVHMAEARRRRKFSIRRVGVALVIAYAIVIVVVCYSPDRLILMPTTRPMHLADETRRTIESPSGEVEIWSTRSTAAHDREPEGYVLAFVGNGSRAENELVRIGPMWSKIPVEIWAMNYPGYGGSQGEALLKNIPPAALAAYDALAKVADGKPIFLSGHSLGTTVAIGLAAQRPVAGLVLHNPPPLRHLIVERYGWFNLWIGAAWVASAVPPGMRSITNAPNCHEPAVFLLASKDTIVPPAYQAMVVQAYAGPKHLVHLPEYLHNDPVWVPPALPDAEKEIGWMWRKAARGRGAALEEGFAIPVQSQKGHERAASQR